jgi:hypothetical protein
MPKKYLIKAFLFVLVAAIALGFSNWYKQYKNDANVLGQYTFAQTRQNIRRMAHIRITTAEDGTFNLKREGEYWRFQEAANYYINTDSLANLYNMINNSVIMNVQPGDKKLFAEAGLVMPTAAKADTKFKGTRIEIFDDEEILLNDLIIGNGLDDGEYHFARQTNGSYVYNVSQIGIFSGSPQSWIPYPLLKIKENMIEALVLDGRILSRQLLHDIKPHLSFIKELLDTLSFLRYDGIAKLSEFKQTFPDAQPQTIKVITPLGLIYALNVYHTDDAYWLTVRLQMDKIARTEVAAFIGENQKYFKDWVFQLSPEQGAALYDTQIGE